MADFTTIEAEARERAGKGQHARPGGQARCLQ